MWPTGRKTCNFTTAPIPDDPRYFDGIIDQIRAKDIVAFARKFFDTAQCIDVVIY